MNITESIQVSTSGLDYEKGDVLLIHKKPYIITGVQHSVITMRSATWWDKVKAGIRFIWKKIVGVFDEIHKKEN